MINNLKGKMFYTSWGYDQTNYDFIIVESISPSGKTVNCRRATTLFNNELSEMTQDALKPVASGFGLPFRMRVEQKENRVWLRGSYPFLSRFDENWDEEQKQHWLKSKRLDTFSEVEEGKHYYQTNSMFGH